MQWFDKTKVLPNSIEEWLVSFSEDDCTN